MVGKRTNRILLLLALTLTATAAEAQLYKWIDDDGRVHYTDKAPGGKQSSTIETGNDATGVSPEQPSSTGPIIRPSDKTAHKLHLLDSRYLWKQDSEISRTTRIGIYYVGKGCVSRGAINAPDGLSQHKALFPSEADMSRTINQVIVGLDYEAEHNSQYKLLSRLQKTGGLSLHSEIIAMDFKTCARDLSSDERLKAVGELSPNRFTRNRVRLQVSWQLRNNRDQDVVYATETDGVFNGWNQDHSPDRAIKNALEDAVLALFTDSGFIDKILVEEDRKPVNEFELAGLKPIKSSGSNANLYVAIDQSNWTSNKSPESEIGNILFGDDCAAGKLLPIGVALNRQKWLTPNAAVISESIVGKVQPLGYSINPATLEKLTQLDRSTGFSLTAKLYNLSYDTCAPSLPASSKFRPIDPDSLHRLSRHRLQIWIEWTLKSNRNRDLLLRSSTMGFAGNLSTDTKGAEVMVDAIGMATERLFSDPEFVDLLNISDRQLPADQPFAAGQSPEPAGIPLGSEQQATQLLIVGANTPWIGLSQSQIGLYAFGADCTPYQQRQWPQALNQQTRHFPSGVELAATQDRVIKSLGYPARVTDQYSLARQRRKWDAYSLQAEIVGLRFDSCAPELAENIVFSDRKIAAGDYKRHRAAVTINWKLIGPNETGILFQKTTEGVADSWQQNSKGEKVLALAVERATRDLFATPEFVSTLTSEPEPEEKGFFGDLFSFIDSEGS